MADTTEQPAAAASETEVKEVKQETAVVRDTRETVVKDAVKTDAPVKDTKTETKSDTAIAGKDKEEKIVGDFPEDWREKMAGGDEKKLKRLERFKSPRDVLDFGLNVEKSWKQGKDPDPFPTEGTDEEKSSWRKAHSIPDKPEEYIKDFTLDGGLVIGDNDKPILEDYLATAQKYNVPPEIVKANLNWYFSAREKQAQDRQALDADERDLTSQELTKEWGQETKKYLGAAHEFIRSFGEDLADDIMEARLPNGTKLGNHPGIIRKLAQVSLEVNPAVTVVPNRANPMSSIETEIGEIEKLMRENRNAYWGDPAKQSRLRELYTAQEKLKQRAA